MKQNVRSLSLIAAAAAGLLGASMARATVTLQVIPSSAPNVFGSPSWTGYLGNAMFALQNGLTSVGDRNTSPTGYQAIPNGATIEAGDVMVTSFNSWRGYANPTGVFANEEGNRLHFGLVATGDGVQQFSLNQISVTIDSNDPGDTLVDHDNLAGLTFNGTTRIGINWGPDRAPGGGDDTILNSGQGDNVLVDQLFYVGVGNAYAPSAADPGSQQDAPLNGTAGYIYNNSPFTVTGVYSIGDDSGTASVNVVPEPTTLGLIGVASLGLLARRRRGRSQN